MKKPTANILIAEDEEMNIEIISEALTNEPYSLSIARDGIEAWDLLQKNPKYFDAILLDRMMPRMDGMEVLKNIKSHNALKSLPVILQTAKSGKEEINEGLREGAYYYLTKPFEPETLAAIIKTAINDYTEYKSLNNKIQQTVNAMGLMKSGTFEFKSLQDGQDLATLLAHACTEPKKAVMGLWELIMNAIEHGNLNITYDEKTTLNDNNKWTAEIEHRISLPENASKKVLITYESFPGEIHFLIIDEGEGFDWEPYLELNPERVFDNHGRGIAMAGLQSFDRIEYKGKGNEVLAVIYK